MVGWFVMQGDDLKTPMIEHASTLEDEERRKMELVFDWTEAYLSHDGFGVAMQKLVERGMSREHARTLIGEVVRERLPRDHSSFDDHDFIDVLPEDREAVDILENDS